MKREIGTFRFAGRCGAVGVGLLLVSLLGGCGSDGDGATGGGGAGGGGSTTASSGGGEPSSTTSTASSSSGGGEGGDAPFCDEAALADVGEPSPVVITIENALDEPVFIDTQCEETGVDGIAVDGTSLDGWLRPLACSSWSASACNDAGCDCDGSGTMQLDPGETLEATWDGWQFEEEAPDLEAICPRSCGDDVGCAPLSCRRRFAAVDGEHVASVRFGLGPVDEEGLPDSYTSASTTFTLPGDAVLLRIE